MNKKLEKLLQNQKVKGGQILDTYNQKVIDNISCTITTRVNASNEIYICDDRDKGINGTRLLNECPTQ